MTGYGLTTKMEKTNKEKFYYSNDWQFGKDDRYTLRIEIDSGEIYLVPTILIYRVPAAQCHAFEDHVEIIFMYLDFKLSIGNTL